MQMDFLKSYCNYCTLISQIIQSPNKLMTWTLWEILQFFQWITVHKKCPSSELFWSVFSRIWTEYGQILHISTYLFRMRENADQNNSEFGHFSRSVRILYLRLVTKIVFAEVFLAWVCHHISSDYSHTPSYSFIFI